jgi:hypothetical protein
MVYFEKIIVMPDDDVIDQFPSKKKLYKRKEKKRKPFCLYFSENKKNSSRAREILEDFVLFV